MALKSTWTKHTDNIKSTSWTAQLNNAIETSWSSVLQLLSGLWNDTEKKWEDITITYEEL